VGEPIDATDCGTLRVRTMVGDTEQASAIATNVKVSGWREGDWVSLNVRGTVPLGYAVFAGRWTLDLCPNLPPVDADFVGGPPLGEFQVFDASAVRYYEGTAWYGCFNSTFKCVAGVADDVQNYMGHVAPAANLNQNDWIGYSVQYQTTTSVGDGGGAMTTDQFSAHMYASGLTVLLLAASLISSWRRKGKR
jgi:hypothetical protein